MEEPKTPTDRHAIQSAPPLFVCGRCGKAWHRNDAAGGTAAATETCEPINDPLELATRVALNIGQVMANVSDEEIEQEHARYLHEYVISARSTGQIDQLLAEMHKTATEQGEAAAVHEAYHSAMSKADEMGQQLLCMSLVAWAFACYRARYRDLATEHQQ